MCIRDSHKLKAVDIADILGLKPPTVSKMLNYQKGFSKSSIRTLSEYFKVSQGAFNRAYDLRNESEAELRPSVDASVGSR